MIPFYSIGIRMYGWIIKLCSMWNHKASLWIHGRKNVFDVLAIARAKHPDDLWIWVHASSLGEYEQGKHLMNLLKNDNPSIKIALSFFSPSGYEQCKANTIADIVFYMPLDTQSNASKTIAALLPKVAIFIKYDFWWNHLKVLQEHKIHTFFISSTFRTDQYFVKYKINSMIKILRSIDHFFVQDVNSLSVLSQLEITQATVVGDSRLDSILSEDTQEYPIIDDLDEWSNDHKIIIYGSVHTSDLFIVNAMLEIEAYHLIVPHDINEANLKEIETRLSIPTTRYSDYVTKGSNNVIILDQMGVLKHIYCKADIIYIGGGFGDGIHNVLEPVIHYKPILIGPKYHKFPEAIALVESKAIRVIEKADNAYSAALSYLESGEMSYSEMQMKYVKENSGASEKISKFLSSYLLNTINSKK